MSTLTLYDRVKESTTTSGTGTVSLLGAATGFTDFNSTVGNGNQTYYVIADQSGGNWEVGTGTYTTSGSTLTRSTVLASSNAGALVSFGTNTKDVFISCPASILSTIGAGSGSVTSVATGTGLTGGPITTTGTISVAAGGIGTTQLAASGVTYAKVQNVGADAILGNPTGSAAAPSEITLGSGLNFSGTTLLNTVGVFTGSAGVTVANTTTETSLLSAGTGSLAISSGQTITGRCFHLHVAGYWSTLNTSPGNLTINFKCGTTTAATTGASAVPTSVGGLSYWDVDIYVNVYSYGGSSGTFWVTGRFFSVELGVLAYFPMINTSPSGIHLLPSTLDLTATWSVASTSNTITQTSVVLTAVN